jgi:hypothetical protein
MDVKLEIENYKPDMRCSECDMGLRVILIDNRGDINSVTKQKCPHCDSDLLISSRVQYCIMKNKRDR